MLLRWAVVAYLATLGLSFNIDTKNVVAHNRPNVKFGYALDFFYETINTAVLVVGAPEAETTSPLLRDIRKAGAVYSCSIAEPTVCKEMFPDQDKGNDMRLNGSRLIPIEDKNNQFFGATVAANRKHNKLMMCAPQYKYFFTKFEVIEPVGACFYLESGQTKAYELSSCRQDNQKHGRHRLGYGQCGFSATVPDEGGRSFIGAPGMFYWQGGVFSQANMNYTDRLNSTYSPKEYDHNMMGYSVATGDFDGDGKEDAVTGAPRGDGLTGKLVLYTSTLKHIINLTDTTSAPQTGQYCGHSIAVTDLNNDGRADIVTGCPFFTDYVTKVDAKTQERKPQYEVGKILVFLQTAPGVFAKPIAIMGEEEWGRFGFSLAHAGDLNQDGYNDIIVGAPHGGGDKKGAVYILHGSKDGIRMKPTQKIMGSSINKRIDGFGFSVAGGVDVDHNGIPDIAVGAVRSGSALVMLAKPVVTVTGRTELDKNSVAVDEKSCEVDKKLGHQACRTIKTCFKYEGKGDTPNDLEFTLTYNLDTLALAPRAHFLQKDIREDRTIKASPTSKFSDHPNVIERVVRLEKQREKCFSQKFFVSSTMRDRLSPIHYSVNYTYEGTPMGKTRSGKLEPALDTTVPLSFEGKLSIANNCGKDDLCIPNLSVSAKADKEKFLLGTDDNTLLLNVDIKNAGEDAFESKLYIDIPEGLEYGGVTVADGKTAPTCTPTTSNDDGLWTWECDLGNPLPATKDNKITFRLNANEKNPPTKDITISARVNSTNPEDETQNTDNFFTTTIPVEYDNSLQLMGQTRPPQIDFISNNDTKTEKFDDRDLGPLVSHMFQVQNNGASRMDVTVDIFWPSFTVDGNNLFYLIAEPTIDKPERGSCRVKQLTNINPLNLRITGDHFPTAAPQPVLGNHFTSEEVEHEADDNFEGDHEEHGAHGGFEYERDPSANAGKAHGGGYEWQSKEDKGAGEFEYTEYDEDERAPSKRVKRQQTTPKRKILKKGEGRRRDSVPAAAPGMARFADLKHAVNMSKSMLGSVDYPSSGLISRATVDCTALRCTHIECDLHDIAHNEYVLIEVHARVDVETLVAEKNPGGDVSSLAVVRVMNQKNRPEKQTMVVAVTTHLNAISTDSSAGGLPWWLYLLAILVGLLILALLILLLWRCGFFKRDRPPTAQAERLATNDPDARYADTKTRYAPVSQDPYDDRGAML